MAVPHKALLDSNVIDFLADDREARSIVEQALKEGRLVLVQTYLLQQQLDKIPDPEKWVRLEIIRHHLSESAEHVPAAGFVLGHSALGESTLLSWDDNDTLMRVMAGTSKGNIDDGRMIMTAMQQGAVFVTFDRVARNRAAKAGVTALQPPVWIRRLVELSP